MDEFSAYLLQFGTLNPQQLQLIATKAHVSELRKGEYFLEAGTVAQHVGFILTGVLRVCYYTNQGEELTRYFVDEHHLVLDVRGIDYGVASAEYVQAVTDCRLLTFSRAAWQELGHTILGWRELVQHIVAKSLIQKLERVSPLLTQDATTRYRTFLATYPQLANRVPLAQLASYLGMTPSSLSRIRKNSA